MKTGLPAAGKQRQTALGTGVALDGFRPAAHCDQLTPYALHVDAVLFSV